MTKAEFHKASMVIGLALSYRDRRKPKSIVDACKDYAKGADCNIEHVRELSTKTVQELFDMLYSYSYKDSA